MNRFRTKKKVKEEPVSTPRASSEEHSFMGFRRKQKAQEEEKKEIDITNVLPPSDDFRTSLLMTGLSARFSMLREQDDPNTKIGKASDDSVLYPKRQSRLMDFGFRGLDDIAEVESIRAPPPFMRTNSYASDTDSLQDSIMSRTRQTDGNNLFGGRQKIYRIPAGAVSTKSVAEGSMGGRALYENDVAMSAFQKLRQDKKDRFLDFDYDSTVESPSHGLTANDSSLLSADTYDPLAYNRSESPSPIDYNLRRETSSTTSSGARNSTAATSVTSQPGLAPSAKEWQSPSLTQSSIQSNTSSNAAAAGPSGVERNTTMRIRRLYEQGLNQDMHEHQNSALSRIDTLTGKRMLRSKTPDPSSTPSPTPSAGFDRFNASNGTVTSTLERLERRQASTKSSATNLQSISPPMSGSSVGSPALPSEIVTGIDQKTPVDASDARVNVFPSSPPLSPPMSDSSGEHAMFSIQPNDVGKATALGMFQKPSLPYDESRFAQRQLQLQQGRETPTERTHSDSDAAQVAAVPTSGTHTPRLPSVAGSEDAQKASKSFLFDDDDDDDEASSSTPWMQQDTSSTRPQVHLQRPSDADHPAFRRNAPHSLSVSKSFDDLSSPPMEKEPKPTSAKTVEDDETSKADHPVDSPTLGPGGGLSGMVLQHLRSTSNASSVYSTMSPQNADFDGQVSVNHVDMSIGGGDFDMKISHPWDEQNWTASIYSSISGAGSYDKRQTIASQRDKDTEPDLPPPPPQKIATQRPPIPEAPKNMFADVETNNRASSLRSVSSRSRITSMADSNRSSNNLDKDEDGDDFASQLANARKRVQERLTTYVESDSSRNTSPLLAPTELPNNPPPTKSNPLGILRAKSSRGSILDRSRDASQSKAMKMLGIGSTTMSTTPSPSKQSFDELSSSSPIPAQPTFSAPPVPDGFSLEALKEERESRQHQHRPEKRQPPLPGREDGYFSRTPTSAPTTAEQSPAVPSSVSSGGPRSSTETEADDADGEDAADTDSSGQATAKSDENKIHPGLQAFRNARRQLQRNKELETMARHQGDGTADSDGLTSGRQSPATGSPPAPFTERHSPPRRERRGTETSAPGGRERKPPPVFYQQREPSQEMRDGNSGNQSRSESRTSGQTERDRSESDVSNNGGYNHHAPPPRPRTNTQGGGGPQYNEYQQHQQAPHSGGHLGPPNGRQGMGMRSPGLPGTDIRRSPHMPPQGYPSGPGGNTLSVQTAMNGGRSPSSGAFNGPSQPSPISPLGSSGFPKSPYFQGSNNGSGPSTPTQSGIPRMQQPRPQQQQPFPGPNYNNSSTTSSLNDSMKKTVRKNEISEPTFLMSTSRVPTVSLPQSTSAPEMGPDSVPNGNVNGNTNGNTNGSGTRSRSNSRARSGSNAPTPAFVPPLPPINPLRKQSGARGARSMLPGFMGGGGGRRGGGGDNGDEMDTMSALTMPIPPLPLSTSGSSSNLSVGSPHSNNYPLGGSASDNDDARLEQRTLRKQRMDLPGGMI